MVHWKVPHLDAELATNLENLMAVMKVEKMAAHLGYCWGVMLEIQMAVMMGCCWGFPKDLRMGSELGKGTAGLWETLMGPKKAPQMELMKGWMKGQSLARQRASVMALMKAGESQSSWCSTQVGNNSLLVQCLHNLPTIQPTHH